MIVNIESDNSDYIGKILFEEVLKEHDSDTVCEVIVAMSLYLSESDKQWVINRIKQFIPKDKKD